MVRGTLALVLAAASCVGSAALTVSPTVRREGLPIGVSTDEARLLSCLVARESEEAKTTEEISRLLRETEKLANENAQLRKMIFSSGEWVQQVTEQVEISFDTSFVDEDQVAAPDGQVATEQSDDVDSLVTKVQRLLDNKMNLSSEHADDEGGEEISLQLDEYEVDVEYASEPVDGIQSSSATQAVPAAVLGALSKILSGTWSTLAEMDRDKDAPTEEQPEILEQEQQVIEIEATDSSDEEGALDAAGTSSLRNARHQALRGVLQAAMGELSRL